MTTKAASDIACAREAETKRLDDGYCPKNKDRAHCEHWWAGGPGGGTKGGKPCHSCGWLDGRFRPRRTGRARG